jgi:DNA-binding Xre family transcriptional regulator
MSQVSLLIDVVKKNLHERGLTYAHVARGLKLSESSVKRVFAEKNLSLDRLEQICELMNLEIADLLELTRAAERRITQLTEEQEQALVSDPKLLLVGVLAISHWTAGHILEEYQLSKAELVGLLTRLDRLQIIDLLLDNRIKVRLAHNFAWRKGGPIQHFFEERVQQQFFKSSFLGEGELRIMLNGSLSSRTHRLLQQRNNKIAE